MTNIFGDQGNSAKVYKIKGIKSEQGMKSTKIRGSWEHVFHWEEELNCIAVYFEASHIVVAIIAKLPLYVLSL